LSFLAHGDFQVTCEGNMLIIDAAGPWNVEFMTHAHKVLLQAAEQVDIKNYGILLTLKGEAIAIDEAAKIHMQFVKQSNTKAVAMNLAECTSKAITKIVFSKIYNYANKNHQYFNQLDDAKIWLTQQLKQND